MDPITVAMGLAQFAPQIIKWITGSDKAVEVAEKAIEIAKTVTGADTPDKALEALKSNPDAVLAYQKAILDNQLELERIASQDMASVNKTMQTEATSEHWPTYSWRPFIGFMFGAYIGSMWVLPLFGKAPVALSPDLTLAVGAILGVASWYRGRMQADPNIPTINRG